VFLSANISQTLGSATKNIRYNAYVIIRTNEKEIIIRSHKRD